MSNWSHCFILFFLFFYVKYQICKVKKITKIAWIWSWFTFRENSNHGRERYKGKTLLGVVNKLLLTMLSNILPLHLKQFFPPIIWFFAEVKVMGLNPGYLLKAFLLYLCMWTLWDKIYLIKNSFWKFYEVRSERGDFNWWWFWSS